MNWGNPAPIRIMWPRMPPPRRPQGGPGGRRVRGPAVNEEDPGRESSDDACAALTGVEGVAPSECAPSAGRGGA
jgi:hypothetical protein